MMLRANNRFLDFDDIVEVERQAKLFEDISSTNGDYSYSFSLPRTANNHSVLNNPFPDNIAKGVYDRIPAQLLNDDGVTLYDGYIRIERIKSESIECSFFSGNNNWFGLLAEPLSVLDFSVYEEEINTANIIAAVPRTSGVVYPFVDNGLLSNRGAATLKDQDFVPALYVKTLFEKIFTHVGIKTNGELFSDSKFNSMIVLTTGDVQPAINARSTFARVTNSPTLNHTDTWAKVIFSDDSNFPYYDGSQNNFDLPNSRYVADVKMVAKFKFVVNNDYLVLAGFLTFVQIAFYVNGVEYRHDDFNSGAEPKPFTYTLNIALEAGDYVEVYFKDEATISFDPMTDAELTVTPIYLAHVISDMLIPKMTMGEFVSNVLRLFNVITSYIPQNQTLTINIFDKITSKNAIDISDSVIVDTVDYIEFISNYAKINYLSYDDNVEDDPTFRFPKISYSKGVIEVDNEYLEETKDILESDFTNPVGYINDKFDAHLEKLDLLDVEEVDDTEFTAAFQSGEVTRLTIVGAEFIFFVGDLVRIVESSDPRYNGEWVISAIDLDGIEPGWIELWGMPFTSDAHGRVIRLNYVYNTDASVFVLHHVPSYTVPKISGRTDVKIETTDTSSIAYAFFNLLDTGKQVNDDFKLSLSFYTGENNAAYQRNLIEQYYGLTTRVLNDPVKLFMNAYLSQVTFERLNFLNPITIRTIDTSNKYYLNRISGYAGGDCTIELIKLP